MNSFEVTKMSLRMEQGSLASVLKKLLRKNMDTMIRLPGF